MNIENNKILMFLFKVFLPHKHELYVKRKAKELWERIEERKNIEKFAMVSGSRIVDKDNKQKWDNVGESVSFYLKKKKNNRVIVVKGTSFEDVKKEYGQEYDFVEPMIKNANKFDGMM